MTTDKSIEAAARAIADHKFLDFERSRDLLMPLARAAIAAFLEAEAGRGFKLMPREPTDAMWVVANNMKPTLYEVERGIAEHGPDIFYEVIAGPSEIWTAMFDSFAYPGEAAQPVMNEQTNSNPNPGQEG